MSNYIDFGIDLGTTNSCLAHALDGEVRVIQNNDQMNVTPSVVCVLPSGALMVTPEPGTSVTLPPPTLRNSTQPPIEKATTEFGGMVTLEAVASAENSWVPSSVSASVRAPPVAGRATEVIRRLEEAGCLVVKLKGSGGIFPFRGQEAACTAGRNNIISDTARRA